MNYRPKHEEELIEQCLVLGGKVGRKETKDEKRKEGKKEVGEKSRKNE